MVSWEANHGGKTYKNSKCMREGHSTHKIVNEKTNIVLITGILTRQQWYKHQNDMTGEIKLRIQIIRRKFR